MADYVTPMVFTVNADKGLLLFANGNVEFTENNLFYCPDGRTANAYGATITWTFNDKFGDPCAEILVPALGQTFVVRHIGKDTIEFGEGFFSSGERRDLETITRRADLPREPIFILKHRTTGKIAHLRATIDSDVRTYHVYAGTGDVKTVMHLERVEDLSTLSVDLGSSQRPVIITLDNPELVIDTFPGRGDWHFVAAHYRYEVDDRKATITAAVN